MRLSDLKTGEEGVVVKVLGNGGFRKRIVEMGFIKGKAITVLQNAPLKDPIKYQLMGYEISLRKKEAEMIEVRKMEEVQIQNAYTDNLPPLIERSAQPSGKINPSAQIRKTINVAMVGNPNSGKTSLFNLASGSHERVGNYGGVTVDSKEGKFEFKGYHFTIVDLPGTYSISTYTPEEMYVRKHITKDTPDLIINVVDASNLERNLYLTTQLIDMEVPMVIALNMFDELQNEGNSLDYISLSKKLGVPMVPTVAKKGIGIDHLFSVIISLYNGAEFLLENNRIHADIEKEMIAWGNQYPVKPAEVTSDKYAQGGEVHQHININHGAVIEHAISSIQSVIKSGIYDEDVYSSRFLAIKLLENDSDAEKYVKTFANKDEILSEKKKQAAYILSQTNEDCEAAITNAKYRFIREALDQTFTESDSDKKRITKKIDALLTHRFWAFPFFFLFMYIMFEATFVLGEYPMNGIEWLVEILGSAISNNMSDGPLKDMLIDGIIGGVGGVIVFLPNILILYFFISLMEDSGYMARAAFIMDKVMQKMGLHGKSFIPLIMGFGCNVPAIMASRTIENRRVRLVTMLVNPLMSCSARLPIYLLFVGVFFPNNASLVLLTIYSIGIILAVIMARIFSRFFGKGDNTPFVMELPPYRVPTAKAIFRHTWEKGVQYLKKMGGIIMIASIIIWFLGYYPQNEAYETVSEQQENSYIGQLGKAIEPAIEPLGFDWKLGIGLLTGVGAKEIVVSSLGVLYANDAEAGVESLAARIPITPFVAFCYMLFSLIYFPCIAVFAAIKNESGSWKWAIFTAVYTTALAWIISFAVYQIGSLFL